jgi:hypothetical protein
MVAVKYRPVGKTSQTCPQKFTSPIGQDQLNWWTPLAQHPINMVVGSKPLGGLVMAMTAVTLTQ